MHIAEKMLLGEIKRLTHVSARREREKATSATFNKI
jgi:hypothetical protein